MEAGRQARTIRCPYCGWKREYAIQMDGKTVVDVVAGTTSEALGGVSRSFSELLAKIKERLQDQKLEEANAWILMPACPNPECKHSYEYQVMTGETRR
jgi:hypothetical protein